MKSKKSIKNNSNIEHDTETSFMRMEDALSETLKNILETKKKKGTIQSGFTELDSLLGNFQKSDLIVVGGTSFNGENYFSNNNCTKCIH